MGLFKPTLLKVVVLIGLIGALQFLAQLLVIMRQAELVIYIGFASIIWLPNLIGFLRGNATYSGSDAEGLLYDVLGLLGFLFEILTLYLFSCIIVFLAKK